MFTSADLQDFIIFDVETASEFESLDDLYRKNPAKAELWSKRCEWLRKKFEENKDLSDEQLYVDKAALQPEFGKIICISIGKMDLSGDSIRISIKSYDSSDEKELLKQFVGNANAILKKLPAVEYVGFNSNRFDVPYITKRCFINDVNVPAVLKTFGVKPWESKHKDFVDIWSGGSWKESFTSLDLVAQCLGVESSKHKLESFDDMDGSEVGRIYWQENDLPRIVKYCEKDVLCLANCLLKISGKDLINENKIISK